MVLESSSRPLARGRGLKPLVLVRCLWVVRRPLARGRGLKQNHGSTEGLSLWSPPRTGAWIETCCLDDAFEFSKSPPRTGAWIETEISLYFSP